MAHERIKPEFLFDEEKIKQLKQIAPECFEDGKLNFETLRQNLGEWVQDEEDGDLEHFGLFWPGKKAARRLATMPPEGTLEPVFGEGLKSDGTPDDDGLNDSKNIFIEGENLEVLKILQKSYANKIKMIYIDPPYNTGNDFVYDDDFTEPLQEYFRRTGQIDEEGKPLTTNKKSDGRFHSKWLSMMYPRLRLARNLLTEDGVIFVSIDDNEVTNLKLLLIEIFGEENFIGTLVWKKKYIGGKHAKHFVDLHEYVHVFAKDSYSLEEIVMERPQAELEKFNQQDEYEELRGKHYTRPLKSNLGLRKTLIYPIEMPDGEILETQWMVSKSTFENLVQDGRIVFKQKKDGSYNVYRKYYQNDGGNKVKVPTLIEDVANADGKVEIKELFKINEGRDIPFDNPKPTKFLSHLFNPILNNNDIILDFFAGSASTGHAVMKENAASEKSLQYIMVQLPFSLDKENKDHLSAVNFCKKNQLKLNIAEVAKFRLREAHKKENAKRGFHVYKLSSNSFKKWGDVQGEDISKLENSLDLFNSSPLRDDWNKNKLLTELILLEGFPLDATQTKSQIGTNEIVKVESEMVPNTLLICLDDEIEESLIDQLELDNASTFICLDSAISNQNKLRLSDKGLIKTI